MFREELEKTGLMEMYFWDAAGLNMVLRHRRLRGEEPLNYLLVFLVGVCLFVHAFTSVDDGFGQSIGFALLVLGATWIYLRNQGPGGDNFVERFIALSVVGMVRVGVGAFGVNFVIGVPVAISTALPSFGALFWLAILFLYVGKQMGDVASVQPRTARAPT